MYSTVNLRISLSFICSNFNILQCLLYIYAYTHGSLASAPRSFSFH